MANDLDTLLMRMKSAASPARQTLRDLHTKYAADVSGTVANYIPELAKANPEWLGISIVSVVPGKLAIGVFSPSSMLAATALAVSKFARSFPIALACICLNPPPIAVRFSTNRRRFFLL